MPYHDAAKSRSVQMNLTVATLAAAFLLTPACNREEAGGDLQASRLAAAGAYVQQDYAAFLQHTQDALELSPQHPTLLYNSAAGYALTGSLAPSIAVLAILIDMGLSYNLMGDSDFSSLQQRRDFQVILTGMARNRVAVVRSQLLWELPDTSAHVEGITYDPVGRRYYFSTIRSRSILTATTGGEVGEFVAPGEGGLMAALGLAVDARRRLLWVTTSGLPQMNGFRAPDEGHSALLAFDLVSGEKVSDYRSPSGVDGGSAFNDLALADDGSVYVSDSRGAIWLAAPGSERLEEIYRASESFQGIVITESGDRLLVAAYGSGIWAIDPATRSASLLSYPADATLLGIDGLASYQGSLVAVQNGVRPYRVLRLALNPGQTAITAVEVLERNHPDHGEPTLGVVVGTQFNYVANSAWNIYDLNGQVRPGLPMKKPIILSLPLE